MIRLELQRYFSNKLKSKDNNLEGLGGFWILKFYLTFKFFVRKSLKNRKCSLVPLLVFVIWNTYTLDLKEYLLNLNIFLYMA